MDNQPPPSQPEPQSQPQVVPTSSNRSHLLLITLIGLVMLVIGLSGGYLLFANRNQQTSQLQTQQTVPASLTQSLKPKPLTKVMTVPIKSSQFEKSIVSTNNCNNPLGLVTYRDEKTNRIMNINSSLNSQFEQSETALLEIETFLKGGNLTPYQSLNLWAFPFHGGCGGASEIFIKELTGITYPNVDKTRTVMVYTTQSAMGEVSVYVLAQKGTDIIRLSKFLDEDRSLYSASETACKNDLSKTEECYKEKLKQDTTLQTAAVKEAKELVNLFSIK